ncbi:MAG: serine/threonine protein kinase [Planctomyces sp.]|nr:serine/threonine protein kinase [Planctomyces sp.]
MIPTETKEQRRWNSLVSVLNFFGTAGPQKRLVPTSDGSAESPEHQLLRRRIRAVALLLFAARVAYIARLVLVENSSLGFSDILVFAGLLLVFFAMPALRKSPLYLLRGVEFLVFIGMALDFSVSLNERLASVAEQLLIAPGNDHAAIVDLVAAIKDHILALFALMMIYGMFIPNTGLRSAGMVLLMAVMSAAVIMSNKESREGLESFRKSNSMSVSKLRSSNLLSLAIGAGCAVYGTIVINQLRRRAQSAEELGQYRLRSKLGSGGMGDVFLAEHKLLRRLCAVKLIRGDYAEDPTMMGRFEREVQATASLTHWNTIQVFDYGQTDEGRFFYVMEYLYGLNLYELVERFGPLPESRVIFLLVQVCDALRESAYRGLVHRDIKPSNIFLANLGNRCDVVKLLDFGLVRPIAATSDENDTHANQINGSPRFMCPEQAQGEVPDIRGDMYSLAAVAYFLLSGHPPFRSDSALQLVISHASRIPPNLRTIGVPISPELDSIVMKCLAKRPEDRFQTPDELQSELQCLPLYGHWTWETAELWWRQNLADNMAPQESILTQVPVGESGEQVSPMLDNTTVSPTDPTLIDISLN